MTRLPPRLPGQATGTAARQGFGGSDGGRVRNASPVRGGRPGTPVSAAAKGDPCSCCKCQRITSGTLQPEDLIDGAGVLVTALNPGCALEPNGTRQASALFARPWVFIDGLLHLAASWLPTDPDENGDWLADADGNYSGSLTVTDLPGSGPWTWAWLWESPGMDAPCFEIPN